MTKIAKLFRNGNSQAVRLPQEMRFKGDRVRVRKVGDTVVLEPVVLDVTEWLCGNLRHHPLSKDFMADGRDQPAAPDAEVVRMRYLLDSSICVALFCGDKLSLLSSEITRGDRQPRLDSEWFDSLVRPSRSTSFGTAYSRVRVRAENTATLERFLARTIEASPF